MNAIEFPWKSPGDNPPYFSGWNPMKILSFGIVAASGSMVATCRTSPIFGVSADAQPGQRSLRSGRKRSEWDSVDVCLGKKSDVFWDFTSGMQGKLWDFTRKNGEVIKINYIDLIWCCLNIGLTLTFDGWGIAHVIDKPTRYDYCWVVFWLYILLIQFLMLFVPILLIVR